MLAYFLPEILLLTGTMVTMLTSLWHDAKAIHTTMLTLLLSLASLYFMNLHQSYGWVVDSLSIGSSALVLIMTGVVILGIRPALIRFNIESGPICTLVLLATLGCLVVVSTDHLLLLFLGTVLIALPSYTLCTLSIDEQHSDEAGFKYFVMGSISGVIFLYGASFFYGATGQLTLGVLEFNNTELWLGIGLSLVVCSLIFKLGAFPFHYWVPDVYQASSLPFVYWVISIPKISYVIALIRILSMHGTLVGPVLWYVGVGSLLFGSVMAYLQTDFRRMLGYASITQMGVVCLLLQLEDLRAWVFALMYLVAYVLSIVLLWQVLINTSSTQMFNCSISQLNQWVKENRSNGLVILITLASLAGIPFTLGFVVKIGALIYLVTQESWWVLGVILFGFSLSAYYYLAALRAMYFDVILSVSGSRLKWTATYLGVIGILALGIYPLPLYYMCKYTLQGVLL